MTILKPWIHGPLKVSSNGRFLQHSDGTPFFWLADTGWLLFSRLNRNEAGRYLDIRKSQGFNVIQVMMVHSLPATNIYGRKFQSLEAIDWKKGPQIDHPDDYWNFIEEITQMAEERGLYMAMVPVWGSIVQEGSLSVEGAIEYGSWLGHHFSHRPNIIWLNGGDVRGEEKRAVWEALGSAIKKNDPIHLMTFHPFGRTRSSEWFQKSTWLDFNMFQSGHRRYDQSSLVPTGEHFDDNPETNAEWKGEDNWRYVLEDLALEPKRPTIDGEPSYEGIPQGLHDGTQSRWEAKDVRRYAYWSVFAGSFGHTYGNNSVFQMHKNQFEPGYFSATSTWEESITDPGALQMRFLKELMESLEYGCGGYSPWILRGQNGVKYNRLIANSGPGYAVIYAYAPQIITINLQKALPGRDSIRARWFDPAIGIYTDIGKFKTAEEATFDPKLEKIPGNDLVLLLTPAESDF